MKVKTGDIVWVKLDPVQGGEKGKTRPCLVITGSGHPWEIVIIVPINEVEGNFRSPKLFVPIPANETTGLKKESSVDCFQIRCITEQRIQSHIGYLPVPLLEDVRTRIAAILDIGEEHVS